MKWVIIKIFKWLFVTQFLTYNNVFLIYLIYCRWKLKWQNRWNPQQRKDSKWAVCSFNKRRAISFEKWKSPLKIMRSRGKIGAMVFWPTRGDISLRKSQELSSLQAKLLTPTVCNIYFMDLNKILEDGQYKSRPNYIWNIDETSISLLHKPTKVLAKKRLSWLCTKPNRYFTRKRLCPRLHKWCWPDNPNPLHNEG